MSKKIQNGDEIYVAPKMLGKYENGNPIIIDELSAATLDPNNLEHKIKIYEREVQGWFLEPASKLLNDEDVFNNSFLILMICMAYIEGVKQYREGKSSNGQSRNFFIDSIQRIFPGLFSDDNSKQLYNDVRSGLFHNGMSKSSVIFNNTFPEALDFSNNKININPTMLLKVIQDDFSQYIQDLNNTQNTTLRTKFDTIFTVL